MSNLSMPIMIVDRNNIMLFTNDILVDDFGSEWILLEEDGEFFFRLRDGEEALPSSYSNELVLKGSVS